jgi:hypothetical protein
MTPAGMESFTGVSRPVRSFVALMFNLPMERPVYKPLGNWRFIVLTQSGAISNNQQQTVT